MALLPKIRVDIASSFNDKGFKKASRSANLLTAQFRKLGFTVASVLSVQAIARYSASAVKAFAEEEAAVVRLTKTFNNLGLSAQAATANDFISNLQKQVAVTDDELRPALESLVRTTLDLGQAQKILGVALDVSAGTGLDLQKVTSALSKAYLGQGATLGKLNIGIGQVEAKTIKFDDALARLQERFGGQAAAAVDTYAGKFKLLSIASEEARESIGQRMLLALELLSKDQSIEGLTSDMEDFADKIGLATVGLGKLLGTMNRKIEIGGRTLGEILFAAAGGGFIDALAKVGAQAEYGVKKRTLGAPGAVQQAAKDAAIRKKALEEQKKSIALQKKAAAEAAKREREAAQLKRANTVFDMENIQIVAAMQGQVDAEQRLRLTALLAINQGNAEAAEKLSTAVLMTNAAALKNLGIMIEAGDSISDVITKIINAQAKLALLGLGIGNIPKAKNPFEDWPDIIAAILAQIGTLTSKISSIGTPGTKTSVTATTTTTVGGGGGGGGGGGAGGNVIIGGSTGAGTGSTQVPDGVIIPGPGNSSIFVPTDPNNPNLFGPGKIPTASVNPLTNANLYGPGKIPVGALSDEERLALALGLVTGSNASAGSFIAQSMDNPNLFGPGKIPGAAQGVTVIVQGSVITETDLAEIITDIQYDYQKAGKDLLLSSTAI